nr:MAG: attachment glycoprotein [Wufeng rodent jeilongvirus 6]
MYNMEYYGANSKKGGSSEVLTMQEVSSRSWLTRLGVIFVTFVIPGLTLLGISLAIIGVVNNDQEQAKINQMNHWLESGVKTMRDLTEMLRGSLVPKIDLISSLTGFTIPQGLIQVKQEIIEEIKTEVKSRCLPQFDFKNITCPKRDTVSHSPLFEEFKQDSITACELRGLDLRLDGNIELEDFPSFIPSPTSRRACIRIPSFAMNPTIWVYTHNIGRRGCNETGMHDQYFSLGVITDGENHLPYFETLVRWYMSDEINRRSCAVAAGAEGGWIFCTVSRVYGREDYGTTGIGSFYLGYLDIFGRKRSWLYEESELSVNGAFTALYPSVGSGVVVKGIAYFLAYGGSSRSNNESCLCYTPFCTTMNEHSKNAACNRACQPHWFFSHARPMVLVSFKLVFNEKPKLQFTVLRMNSYWMGTEARLIHNYRLETTYIYMRSASWHTSPQVGMINLMNPREVIWVTHKKPSRPGDSTCPSGHSCPVECTTGVYTDLFPLGKYYEYTVGVYLDDSTHRISPKIGIFNVTHPLQEHLVSTVGQHSGYTTTTCFIYGNEPWCLSILEMAPSTIGVFSLTSLLYKLPLKCISPYANNNQGLLVKLKMNQVVFTVPSINIQRGIQVNFTTLLTSWPQLRMDLPLILYTDMNLTENTGFVTQLSEVNLATGRSVISPRYKISSIRGNAKPAIDGDANYEYQKANMDVPLGYHIRTLEDLIMMYKEGKQLTLSDLMNYRLYNSEYTNNNLTEYNYSITYIHGEDLFPSQSHNTTNSTPVEIAHNSGCCDDSCNNYCFLPNATQEYLNLTRSEKYTEISTNDGGVHSPYNTTEGIYTLINRTFVSETTQTYTGTAPSTETNWPSLNTTQT